VKNIPLSILIIDDNSLSLPLYKECIDELLGHDVDVASTPSEAWHLASRCLYDIIICDAKLPYKHSNLGGLILADELSLRFGKDSVLVISQFMDNADLITQSIGLPFLKKPDAVTISDWFGKVLDHKMKSMRKRQFGFVAMPFNNESLDKLFSRVIKKACQQAGIPVLKVVDDPSSQNIINKTFSMITEAHFVIFLSANNNPNVFYEAGYAFALKKEIIMCAPTLDCLPFDVKSNVCLAYENRVDLFKGELENTLFNLRKIKDYSKIVANKSLKSDSAKGRRAP
jgi:CheY-like chemotaxis protein